MTQPLIKQIWVPTTPARAFKLFTAHIAQWWPLETHSVGLESAVGVEIEPRIGGHIVEKIKDGRTSIWGTVTKWDPPAVFACTWHPGNDPSEATDVEVRFIADGDKTQVELVHSGWERRPEFRAGYDTGWDFVLGHFEDMLREPV